MLINNVCAADAVSTTVTAIFSKETKDEPRCKLQMRGLVLRKMIIIGFVQISLRARDVLAG